MLFEFVLFVILGIMVFAPPVNSNLKLVLTIVFVVLMIVWVALGIGPTMSSSDWPHFFRR